MNKCLLKNYYVGFMGSVHNWFDLLNISSKFPYKKLWGLF